MRQESHLETAFASVSIVNKNSK